MLIYAYWCGELDHTFTEKDTEQVAHMCGVLDTPFIDTWTFELENGDFVMFWRGADGTIHGNINGHDESEVPESAIANGTR